MQTFIIISVILIILILFYYLKYLTNLMLEQTNTIINKMETKKENKNYHCFECGSKINDIGMSLYFCENCKETFQLDIDEKGIMSFLKSSTVNVNDVVNLN